MIQRIELINFMSHPHTVLELDQGLTVLVGENNTGKSAIVNALQVLCTNAQGDYMVRHGEKESLVRVQTSEGHTLEWKRKGRTVSYTVNGREVHRLGGSVPEDLHGLLRLPRVETEAESFDIHFGEQKDPIFLLNTSPGKRATFFASSSDTIKLIEMQNLHKKKVQDARWKESRLKQDEARQLARLGRLAQVEELGVGVESLEALHADIIREEEQIKVLKEAIARLEKSFQNLAACRARSETVSSLTEPPRMAETGTLQGLLAGMARQGQQIGLEQARDQALRNLNSPPALQDTEHLKGLIRSLEETDRRTSRNSALAASVEGLQVPPALKDTGQLQDLINQIQLLSRTHDQVHGHLNVLAEAEPPPALDDLESIRGLIHRLATISGQTVREGRRSDILGDMGPLPDMDDPEGLRKLILEMDGLLASVQARERVQTSLAPLELPPDLVDPSELRALLNRLNRADQERVLLQHELEQVEQVLSQAAEALRDCVARIGVCPTCGQDMDPDRIMEHEHARTAMSGPAWQGGES